MNNLESNISQRVLFVSVLTGLMLMTIQVQAEPLPIPERGPVPFHVYDIDSNGCISPDELARVQAYRMERRGGMRPGAGMGNYGQAMGRGRQQQNRPTFDYFDKNADGYISEQELIEGRSMRISNRIQQGYQMRNTANIPQFNEIDSNSDGNISREEFEQYQIKHQQQRRGGM